jgi:hypothetical protein
MRVCFIVSVQDVFSSISTAKLQFFDDTDKKMKPNSSLLLLTFRMPTARMVFRRRASNRLSALPEYRRQLLPA